jgi:hypothetical protein
MGDTRRVVDGEESATLRPLRPAAPPDGPAAVAEPAVPRPRRSRLSAKRAPSAALPKPADEPKTDDTAKVDATPTAGAGVEVAGRRRRVPFAHALRQPPRQLATGAARATRDWSRRPAGRVTSTGLSLLLLVAATGAAGALLVPRAAPAPEPVAVDTTPTVVVTGVPGGEGPGAVGVPPLPPGATALPGATGLPGGTALPGGTGVPGATGLPGGPAAGAVTGRPADALAGWALQMSAKTGIPPVAMQAYGYAELVLAQTDRACQLSWTTLAAIGYVESGHGSANHATLQLDGRAVPEIIGDPLDGQGGRSRILDTDKGQLDKDTVYDRALGPMQFIPGTWRQVGADADGDGRIDPHDIDDAALAAGNYLCQGGRNMTIAGDWWGAILSYNDVRRYAQDVFGKADEYGRASRT